PTAEKWSLNRFLCATPRLGACQLGGRRSQRWAPRKASSAMHFTKSLSPILVLAAAALTPSAVFAGVPAPVTPSEPSPAPATPPRPSTQSLEGAFVAVFAIGGETTGTWLETDQGNKVELDLQTNGFRAVFVQGLRVRVEGSFTQVAGIEIPKRSVLV